MNSLKWSFEIISTINQNEQIVEPPFSYIDLNKVIHESSINKISEQQKKNEELKKKVKFT